MPKSWRSLAGRVRAPIARGLPLPVLAALLSLSGGFVGNDSGVSHLAAAVKARTIALFGPTDPAFGRRGVALVRVASCDMSAEGAVGEGPLALLSLLVLALLGVPFQGGRSLGKPWGIPIVQPEMCLSDFNALSSGNFHHPDKWGLPRRTPHDSVSA